MRGELVVIGKQPDVSSTDQTPCLRRRALSAIARRTARTGASSDA